MAIKSETKTLQLTFVDGASKNVSYSISNPKADLTKETVDTAAQTIVDKGVDDVVIAVFPFDEVYFSYDRPCFIFHPDFIGSIL